MVKEEFISSQQMHATGLHAGPHSADGEWLSEVSSGRSVKPKQSHFYYPMT